MSKPGSWSSVEIAFMTLLVRDLADLDGSDLLVGGDFGYTPDMPFYIRIDKVPGGSTDAFEGTFVLDVEVFSPDYLLAENVSFRLEALAVAYPHSVVVAGQKVVFDRVTQNVGVADLPWEDDSTYRLGATYVITMRRPTVPR